MNLSPLSRKALQLCTALALLFLYLPLMVVVVLSFNEATSLTWPPTGFSTQWWERAQEVDAIPSALWTSTKIALWATTIALILGTLAAFAVARFSFFGRNTVSFLLVLPISLPGIVTAIALANTFTRVWKPLGFRSVVVAHATFCIVVVFNNVVARLRRTAPNLAEASADLGADGLQTFWYVTLPLLRSALFAGGLLAFALSFDEIVVTTFTSGPGVETLPQWIFNNFSRPNQVPVVNVVASVVIVLSIPIAWLAQRLTEGPSLTTTR